MLLVTTGILPRYEDLWPIVVALVGFLAIYLVHARQLGSWYLVPGFFFLLGGLLLTLQEALLPGTPLELYWPVYMTIAGISLAVYGGKLQGSGRIKALVPAWGMIILSLIFLPFSLGLIKEDFSRIAATWWPLLFILLGLWLLEEYLRKRRR